MSRILEFPQDHALGDVYIVTEGQQPEKVEAIGSVAVPEGSRGYLMLSEPVEFGSALFDGLDDDVVASVQATSLHPTVLPALATQTALSQLAVSDAFGDAAFHEIGRLTSLQVLDVALHGAAGPGLASLVRLSLKSLRLHGDPGSALGRLASSTDLAQLHFHAQELDAAQLVALGNSPSLTGLDIELVLMPSSEDSEAVAALAELAPKLSNLSLSTADGETPLAMDLIIALLHANDELTVNGASYTAAAISRLERKLATA